MISAAEALDVGCLHNRRLGIWPLLASFLVCFFFFFFFFLSGYEAKSVLSILTWQMLNLVMKQGGCTLQTTKTLVGMGTAATVQYLHKKCFSLRCSKFAHNKC